MKGRVPIHHIILLTTTTPSNGPKKPTSSSYVAPPCQVMIDLKPKPSQFVPKKKKRSALCKRGGIHRYHIHMLAKIAKSNPCFVNIIIVVVIHVTVIREM